MADFDPDAFLQGAEASFDPDAFLQESGGFDPDAFIAEAKPAFSASPDKGFLDIPRAVFDVAAGTVTGDDFQAEAGKGDLERIFDPVSKFGKAISILSPTVRATEALARSDSELTPTFDDQGNFQSFQRGEVDRTTARERLVANDIDPDSGFALAAQVVSEVIDPTLLPLAVAKAPATLGRAGSIAFGSGQAATAVGAAEGIAQISDEGEIHDVGKLLTDTAFAAGAGSVLEGGLQLYKAGKARNAARVLQQDNAAGEIAGLARTKVAEGSTLSDAFRDAAVEMGYASKKGAAPRATAQQAAEGLSDVTGSVKELQRVIDEDLFLTGSRAGHATRQLARAAGAPIRAIDKDGTVRRTADQLFGVTSTRMNNLYKPMGKLFRETDLKEHKLVQARHIVAKPFIDSMRAIRKSKPHLAKLIDEAVANGDTGSDALMRQAGIPPSAISDVRLLLTQFRRELQESGLIEEGLEDFFPRMVKDVDGLRAAMGRESRSKLERALQDAQNAQKGRPLSEAQRNQVFHRLLRNGDIQRVGAGGRSSRTVDELTPEYATFYKNSEDALEDYIRYNTRDIVWSPVLGKGADQGQARQLAEEASPFLTPAQNDELLELIEARAAGANLAMNPALRSAKDVSYLVTVANPLNALVQMADIPLAAYRNGITPTLRAMVQSVRVGKAMKGLDKLFEESPEQASAIYKAMVGGNTAEAVRLAQGAGLKFQAIEEGLDVVDFGIANNIAADMTQDAGKLTKAVHEAFKWSGFSKLDRFGKRVHMNASHNKLKKFAAMKDDKEMFRALDRKYGDAYDLEQAMIDVRAGNLRTDAVNQLVWHDLLEMQPITLTELPEFYLRNPNARLFYTLKSFGLKQLDVVRRDVAQELMKGEIGVATKNAMALAAAVTLGTGSYRAGKDLILTGEMDDPHSYGIDALLGLGLASQYTLDQLTRGDVRGVVSSTILPPSLDTVGAAVEDMVSLASQDAEFSFEMGKHLPVIKDFMKHQESQ